MASQEELLKKELESLSDDELVEFESQLQAPQQVEAAPEVDASLIDPRTEFGSTDIEAAKATALGAVEGVPFAKDAIAGAETLMESGINEFGENFSKNKQEWDDAINKAETDHPVEFTMGDIASNFAVPGAQGIKGVMTLGALSGLSRSEDRDIWDAISGAAIAGGASKAISGTMGVIHGVGKKLGLLADEAVKDVILGTGSKVAVNKHIQKHFNKGGKLTDEQATSDFANFVMKKKVNGKSIIEAPNTPDTTAQNFNNWKSSVNDKLDVAFTKDNRVLDDIEVENIYRQLKSALNIEDVARAGGKQGRDKAVSLVQLLDDQFVKHRPVKTEKLKKFIGADKNGNSIFEDVLEEVADGPIVFSKITLKELQAKKRFFGETAANAFDKVSNTYKIDNIDFYKKGQGVLGDAVDDLVEDASIKALNKEWATANMGAELSREFANKVKAGPMDKLKEMFNLRTVLLLSGGLAGGPGGLVVGGTLAGLNKMSADPTVGPKLAVGLRKLSDHISINPSSEHLQRLAVASSLSIDSFREALSASISEIGLMDNAVARTSDDVMTKSDDILQVIQHQSPEMAAQLREAIDNDDAQTIGALMDQASKLPGASKFIQPGRGWDGKVYTEEDKAQLDGEISTMDISLMQKLQHKKALREIGTIPIVQSEPDRFFQWKQRDKSEPSF